MGLLECIQEDYQFQELLEIQKQNYNNLVVNLDVLYVNQK